MANKEDNIYRDLQKHMDKLSVGFPVTESGIEIRVLKHLFTPNEAEKSGLILQASNSKKINFICTCCACCCGALQSAINSPQPVELYQSNYYAGIDSELCVGCKVCLDRCQMNALSMVDNLATVNYDLCIGCGLCVTTCSGNAIKLKKKKKKYKPPKGPYRLFLKIAIKRLGRWKVIKIIMNAIFSLKIYYMLKKN